jgi:CubicO group peptidase (beta-lactamase class C family)
MRNLVRLCSLPIVVFLFVWLLPVRGRAQRGSGRLRGTSPALQQAVSAASVKYKIPGLAVAFIKRGEPMDIAVFGSRDGSSGAPINRTTVFEAGSLGEPVYAYAVLSLVAERRLDLGSPLTKNSPLPYVRDMDALAPSSATEPIYDPRFDQITALRILNHTSGMPDWARNDHLRLRFTPGQQWSYSNEGYVYLQHMVEHITGQPQESLLARSVLGPFGMSHTSFVWREEYGAEMATGHDASGAAVATQHYARPAAAATLYTTIEDYARFVTALLASAPALRTHESVVSLMLNPTVTVDSSFSFLWGLGCGIEKSGDDVYFFHRGAGGGFQSFFMASRKLGTGVVILTNGENGLDAVPDIVAATIGGIHPVLKAPFLHAR